jgi:hypothetical protein
MDDHDCIVSLVPKRVLGMVEARSWEPVCA